MRYGVAYKATPTTLCGYFRNKRILYGILLPLNTY